MGRPNHGNYVSDAQQGHNDQEGLGRFFVLNQRLVCLRLQLNDDHLHDPDQENRVASQQHDQGSLVHPVYHDGLIGRRDEWTAGAEIVSNHIVVADDVVVWDGRVVIRIQVLEILQQSKWRPMLVQGI